jgi:hypothetical protein
MESLSYPSGMLCGMKHESVAVRIALGTVLRQQGDLITRSQALAAGMTEAALRHRTRVDGPWSVVLPGIYLAHNGLLTAGQREIAAVLYAGRRCVVTGPASLQRQGVRVPLSDYVGKEFLAQPDLWWRNAGVAGELDSREWHLSPELWKKTMARHAAMSARGIIVLHFPPSRIKSDAAHVIEELRSAIDAGLSRPPLAIRTIPHQ